MASGNVFFQVVSGVNRAFVPWVLFPFYSLCLVSEGSSGLDSYFMWCNLQNNILEIEFYVTQNKVGL